MTTAVVVTYNSARWIERCLASVTDTSTVVVDNASHDRTAAIVRARHPEVELVVRAKNGGFAVAVNDGARRAPKDDILLLNADAIARPGSIAALEAYLRDHPRVGIVAPQLLYPDGSRQDKIRTFPTPLTMLARRSPLGRTGLGKRILRDHFLHESSADGARPIPATIGLPCSSDGPRSTTSGPWTSGSFSTERTGIGAIEHGRRAGKSTFSPQP